MQAPKFLQVLTDKKQREHFWFYYKGHVAVAAFILILLTMTIVDISNNNRPTFQIAYVNIPPALEVDWTQHFTDTLPTNLERELFTEAMNATESIGIVELEATLNHIFARIAAGEIDIFVADQETFHQFATGELFDDLQAHLPEEFISSATDHLYYSNVKGVGCVTGLLWRHPTTDTTYVFAIPYSSTLKEPAATMIQSLFHKGDSQ